MSTFNVYLVRIFLFFLIPLLYKSVSFFAARFRRNTTIMTNKKSADKCLENGKVSENGNAFHLFDDFSLKKNDFEKTLAKVEEANENVPFYVAVLATAGYYMLLFLGYLNTILFSSKCKNEKNREGYPPLYDKKVVLFLQNVFRRLRDGLDRPIASVAGTEILLKDRITKDNGWTLEFTGTYTMNLNLGSYNYLGFGENKGMCSDDSVAAIAKYGCATSSTRMELGTVSVHVELEKLTARFLGVEEAITFGMGFATNVLNLTTIISKKCLVLSDEKNHASIILGLKLAGATIRIYKHNDMESLESNLVEAFEKGQPNTGEAWKKLFIVTEGIFSMEGSIVKLPEILEIKKKYKAYLYLDEAHSIGALGPHGRGVTDYFNCDPKEVDILMGTFTKSFGSAGGYIAGSKSLIDHIRAHSDAVFYASAMPPPVAQQIISSMKIIMGEDGTNEGQRRIRSLARNTQYFRRRLRQMGCVILGNEDSPVVPMMVYFFSKLIGVVRAYSSHNIATVGVGHPVTPLYKSRIRFCLSAGHTLQQIKEVLNITEKIADEYGLRYSSQLPLNDFKRYEKEDEDLD